jgi:hypothetical protein
MATIVTATIRKVLHAMTLVSQAISTQVVMYHLP